MKVSTALFFILLTAASASCNGQSASQKGSAPRAIQPTALAASDTVSRLDKSILIVFQAANGVYWFGSDSAGIFRYDGKALVHFELRGGLPNNRIREIQEDSAGNIYFTTPEGVTSFDGRHFSALSPAEKASPDDWKLAPGDMWFRGKRSGVYRYDGQRLYHLQFPKNPMEDAYFVKHPNQPWSPYEVYVTYKDRRGAMWFGTCNFGFYRYDGVSLQSIYEQHLMETPEGGWFASRAIMEDQSGKFWINSTSYRYNISRERRDSPFISYDREDGITGFGGDSSLYFFSMLEDDTGDLWMATYAQGVWRYDGEKMRQYEVMDNGKPTTLFSIYKDRRGDLWLGTHNSSAYKFNGEAFEKFIP